MAEAAGAAGAAGAALTKLVVTTCITESQCQAQPINGQTYQEKTDILKSHPDNERNVNIIFQGGGSGKKFSPTFKKIQLPIIHHSFFHEK